MNFQKIIEAYEFAKEAHKGQFRKTGEPYITHPVIVADIALGYSDDTITACACLLHDVVEDTPVTLEEIGKRFGKNVEFIVDGVTKRETPQETYKKIELYSNEDKRVIMVKLCDRIHNTSTLNEKTEDVKKKYKISNPWYIQLGGKLGYNILAQQLNNLTLELD